MFFDGTIRLTYLQIEAQDGLVGLSKESSFISIIDKFLPSDFSAYPPCLPPISLAVPSTAREGDGTLVGQGRVTIPSPLSADLRINIACSDLTEVQVPTNVVIAAGQTNVTFDLAIIDDALLDGTRVAVIGASASASAKASASISVLDNDTAILGLNLPASVIEGAGAVSGTVTVSRSPANDTQVALRSSDTLAASVPPFVTVVAGQTSAVFNVSITDDAAIDGTQATIITAEVANWTSAAKGLSVRDNETTNLTLSLPAEFTEGTGLLPGSGVVYLSGILATNLEVSLAATGAGEVMLPAAITIPAGQSSQSFEVTLGDDAQLDGTQMATITAGAHGFNAAMVTVSVLDDETPLTPSNPDPPDFSMASPDADLSWSLMEPGPPRPTVFDVYFGQNPDPGPAELLGSTSNTRWALPLLASATTYYWRIVARRAAQTPGPIWTFSTHGVASFEWSAISTPQWANTPFSVTITAKDSFGRTVSNFTDAVTISAMNGAGAAIPITPDDSADFIDGRWQGTVSVLDTGAGIRLKAQAGDDGDGFSGTFNVYRTDDVLLLSADSADPVNAGQTLTYHLIVTNTGPSAATGLIITNLLPASVVFASATASQGSVSTAGRLVVANVGTLPPAGVAAITINVTPSIAGLALTNSATLKRNESDPHPANDIASTITLVRPPSLSIGDAMIAEGDAGTVNASFVATLSAPSAQPISVELVTTIATADADDFFATNGIVTFAPGVTSQVISVAIKGDVLNELNETFFIHLSGVSNATIADGSGIGTILNDDGTVGDVKRYVWSPISSPQFVGQPFTVRITALDPFENPANFTGAVALSASSATSGMTDGVVQGFPAHTLEETGGAHTFGFAFTPAQDILVTHLRHYFGQQVSIWSDAGNLLLTQNVNSQPGAWVERPLSQPLMLPGGRRYRLGVFSSVGTNYFRHDPPAQFAHGTIDYSCYWVGDNFPLSLDPMRWPLVDVRYTTSAAGPMPITPATSGPFTNGVWTGAVTVQQAAADIVLTSTDSAGHQGASRAIEVLPSNDLSITASHMPDPAISGEVLAYTLRVLNKGPNTISGVVVSNRLPASVNYISAITSQGTVSHASGVVTVTAGELAAVTNVTIAIEVVPTLAGVTLTNLASVSANQTEPLPGNNVAETRTTVYGPITIVAQPQHLTVIAGATFTFSVVASGVPLISYQWQLDGANIPGATNATLSFTDTQLADAGTYRVLVSNSRASVTSAPAVLTVNIPSGGGLAPSYIRVSIPAGYSMITTPFVVGSNTLAELIPSPPNGTTMLKLNGNGFVANNYLDGWSDPRMTFVPGEGCFMKNPDVSDFPMTLVGEPSSAITTRLPAGHSVCGVPGPQSGLLATELEFPIQNGDTIFIWDRPSQAFAAYRHSSGSWFPTEPFVQAAQSFWVQKGAGVDWIHNIPFGVGTYLFQPNALAAQSAQINFFTYNPNPSYGKVFAPDSVTLVSTGYLAQLYAAIRPVESELVSIGRPSTFLSDQAAGHIDAGIVSIAGLAGGQRVFLQLRVWEGARGGTYGAALANGGRAGKSAIFPVIAGAPLLGNHPGMPPPDANTFASFGVRSSQTNSPPLLAAISDQVIHAQTTLRLTNQAMDPDGLSDQLTFSLAAAPPGALIHPHTGLFLWTPTDLQAPSTNLVAVRVTDDGVPNLSDSQSFQVRVESRPVLTRATLMGGNVTLSWSAIVGKRYRLQYKDNLDDPIWRHLSEEVVGAGATVTFSDVSPSVPQRFYCVQVVP